MRENNNIKYFDKVYLSEKNYISRINGDGIDYLISALIKEWKRFYSSSITYYHELN